MVFYINYLHCIEQKSNLIIVMRGEWEGENKIDYSYTPRYLIIQGLKKVDVINWNF